MKIYDPKPIHIIRINIKQHPNKVEHINFCETSINEIIKFCEESITKYGEPSIFIDGHRITIEVRESMGAKNGKSKSFSFYSKLGSIGIYEAIKSFIKWRGIETSNY